jgi:hypothetical protein
MISVTNRRRIILAFTTFLIVLMVAGFIYVISHGVDSDRIPETPAADASPGLVVYGYVRDKSGTGVENVDIYRSYASYPGEVIAKTDSDGYYESDFHAIPGDEMVTVWASGQELEYDPEQYYWRHYYGYEQAECNFTAYSALKNYLPIVTR